MSTSQLRPLRSDRLGRDEVERRVLVAAADLLARSGLDEVSMRAVAAAAGVQTPTLYRLFEDKQTLLRRLTAFAFERYLAEKHQTLTGDDPVTDLLLGWDLHVDFGLDNPAVYSLMFARADSGPNPAAEEAAQLLLDVLQRAAARGVLTTSVEEAAVRVHAATVGATLYLLGLPAGQRDRARVAPLRDAVLASLRTTATLTTTAAPATTAPGAEPPGPEEVRARARALLTALPVDEGPTPVPAGLRSTELPLLRDWLERISR